MHKFIHHYFIRLLLLTTLGVLSPNAISNTIKISEYNENTNLNISNEIEILEASTIEKNLSQFKKNTADELKQNYSKDPLWIKFSIENSLDREIQKIIFFTSTLTGTLDFSVFNEDGALIRREVAGSSINYNKRILKSIEPAFKVKIRPQQKINILIKRTSRHRLDTKIYLADRTYFETIDQEKKLILMFYFGAIISILFYNLLIYIYSKDHIYLFYCLFAGSLCLLVLNLHGGLDFFLRLEHFNFSSYVLLCSSSALLWTLIFAYKFLKIKSSRKCCKNIFYLLTLLTLTLITTVFTPLFTSHSHILGSAIDLLIPVSLLFILVLTVMSVIQKNIIAKFYLTSFFFIFSGVFIWYFKNLGLLPQNVFTTNSLLIANILEMITIALGLAYKITFVDKAHDQIKRETLLHQKYLRLSRVLSHDISNSLFIITGFSKKVLRSPEILNRPEIWNKISRASKNITEIIYQVRGELNENESLVLADVNFSRVICESVFTFEDKLRHKNIKIINNTQKDLSIYADETSLLNHVVNNIISNSIKFSKENSSITISNYEDKGCEVIVFTDTGIGISEEKISQFTNYKYMFSTKGTGGEEGTGHGMPLLHNYMEKFGGKIEIISSTDTNNSGTSIKLYFPNLT